MKKGDAHCNGPANSPHSTNARGPLHADIHAIYQVSDEAASRQPCLPPHPAFLAESSIRNAGGSARLTPPPSGVGKMNPQIRSFHHSATGTWTHVVVDPATRRAAIIDPVLDFDMASGRISTGSAQRILEYIATTDLAVEWILETHVHADHLSAAAWLKRQRTHDGASPAIGIGKGITSVQETFKKKFNLDDQFVADGRQFDALFVDGETLCVGDLDGQVIATPGHTPDSITYQFGDAIFVGNTVFAPRSGTARCDFPGADAATLYRSIQRLYSLPDETRVFLAHDYPPAGEEAIAQTTIGDEKSANIHLRSDTPAAGFIAMRTKRDAGLATPTLLWPALQVNIRGGHLPPPETRDRAFLKIPLDSEGFDT